MPFAEFAGSIWPVQRLGTVLSAQSPTSFTFELCSHGERVRRHDALVRELESRCNRRIL